LEEIQEETTKEAFDDEGI